MALSAARIAADFKAAFIASGALDNARLDTLCTAMATAVVNEIKTNGSVAVTGTATGAMGGGAGVPVTGTGTIT